PVVPGLGQKDNPFAVGKPRCANLHLGAEVQDFPIPFSFDVDKPYLLTGRIEIQALIEEMSALIVQRWTAATGFDRAGKNFALACFQIVPIHPGRLNFAVFGKVVICPVNKPSAIFVKLTPLQVILWRSLRERRQLQRFVEGDLKQPHSLISIMIVPNNQRATVPAPTMNVGVLFGLRHAQRGAMTIGGGYVDISGRAGAQPGPGHPAAVRRNLNTAYARYLKQGVEEEIGVLGSAFFARAGGRCPAS